MKNAGTDGEKESLVNLEARRRLLKASAAAPLVAMITPNSALAMASATCEGGDFSNKKFLDNGNSINGDTAIRCIVDYWQKKPGNNPTGLANKLYFIEGSYWDQSGAEQFPSGNWEEYYEGPIDAYVLRIYEFNNDDLQEVGCWPMVQYDNINTFPVSTSCYTSLTGGDIVDRFWD